jgi:hypothetical protein
MALTSGKLELGTTNVETLGKVYFGTSQVNRMFVGEAIVFPSSLFSLINIKYTNVSQATLCAGSGTTVSVYWVDGGSLNVGDYVWTDSGRTMLASAGWYGAGGSNSTFYYVNPTGIVSSIGQCPTPNPTPTPTATPNPTPNPTPPPTPNPTPPPTNTPNPTPNPTPPPTSTPNPTEQPPPTPPPTFPPTPNPTPPPTNTPNPTPNPTPPPTNTPGPTEQPAPTPDPTPNPTPNPTPAPTPPPAPTCFTYFNDSFFPDIFVEYLSCAGSYTTTTLAFNETICAQEVYTSGLGQGGVCG